MSWIEVLSGWASGRLSEWITTRPIFMAPPRAILGEPHAVSERSPRAEPRRLPTVLPGPVGGARVRLDAHGVAVVAGAHAHRLAAAPGPHRHAAVRADPALLDLHRRHRRSRPQAPAADGDADHPGGAGAGAGRAGHLSARALLARRGGGGAGGPRADLRRAGAPVVHGRDGWQGRPGERRRAQLRRV